MLHSLIHLVRLGLTRSQIAFGMMSGLYEATTTWLFALVVNCDNRWVMMVEDPLTTRSCITTHITTLCQYFQHFKHYIHRIITLDVVDMSVRRLLSFGLITGIAKMLFKFDVNDQEWLIVDYGCTLRPEIQADGGVGSCGG